ncbi:MAG: MaoC/PaaZ C-terminal domain-containing protein [Suilimivivens sp.]
MLTASFLSTVIASEMPGPGTIYMEQNARFVRPVFIDDTITAHVEILELMEKKKCKLKTVVLNQNNEIVVDGYAIVKLPE